MSKRKMKCDLKFLLSNIENIVKDGEVQEIAFSIAYEDGRESHTTYQVESMVEVEQYLNKCKMDFQFVRLFSMENGLLSSSTFSIETGQLVRFIVFTAEKLAQISSDIANFYKENADKPYRILFYTTHFSDENHTQGTRRNMTNHEIIHLLCNQSAKTLKVGILPEPNKQLELHTKKWFDFYSE